MGFAEGELKSILQFILFLPLLFKICVYASAFSRIKEHTSILLHKLYLVSVNTAVTFCLLTLIDFQILLSVLMAAIMFAAAPLAVLAMMQAYHMQKPILRYLIYFGIMQFLIWLAFMQLPAMIGSY